MNNAAPAPPPAPARTRGRPRGNPPTRESIVSAARALFLERGYRRTTLRAVAGAAGVDPALIAYHFSSKKGLFADVMQFHCATALAVDDVLGGDAATLPDRLIDAVTGLWEDADFRRLTAQGDEAAEVIREYLERELLARLGEFLGGRDATARATAVVTILGGLIYVRYLPGRPHAVRDPPRPHPGAASGTGPEAAHRGGHPRGPSGLCDHRWRCRPVMRVAAWCCQTPH